MPKRIKILFTIPNFDTAGSGKVVYDLVKGLNKDLFDPEICCFHNRGGFYKHIEALGVKIHVFPFAVPYKPYWSLPFRILKIARFFKRHQFDLIHSWHWSSDVTEPLAAKIAGIPFVYSKKAMGWGNKAWLWRSKLSNRIIAINKDMISQFFNRLEPKVAYIPLGIDTNHFKPQKPDKSLANTLGIRDSNFVVVTVANLVPVKGIEVLIESITQINDFSVKLLIVGDYGNDYGLRLKSKYESEAIRFIGKQNDVRPYLALADVFVIPTKDEGRKEGLPIAPIEAMASGKIVVGSRVSGVKDVLSVFENHLVTPSNVAALSLKLKELKALTEKERETLGLQMRSLVLDKYNLNECINKHEVLYKLILGCE
ncbi:glycosyltransferase family 4 protein [Seonamhaeicola aphaedonensis]|uniref:Glycosyltransferase involved in cell wall biosynthesis n=1 Tax=Seonamhaeicola aphaedonensis TaxID=1461338 RepID=A0A3D9HFV2_9FLAO|nr:glycosyltransferase family 4 protein [Seonamhaeicola aphaedonensis]RED48358.1 glycosyltransferase involved in cell wall biosynthesis [Seonamhaeicola aphaedonensis]